MGWWRFSFVVHVIWFFISFCFFVLGPYFSSAQRLVLALISEITHGKLRGPYGLPHSRQCPLHCAIVTALIWPFKYYVQRQCLRSVVLGIFFKDFYLTWISYKSVIKSLNIIKTISHHILFLHFNPGTALCFISS